MARSLGTFMATQVVAGSLSNAPSEYGNKAPVDLIAGLVTNICPTGVAR